MRLFAFIEQYLLPSDWSVLKKEQKINHFENGECISKTTRLVLGFTNSTVYTTSDNAGKIISPSNEHKWMQAVYKYIFININQPDALNFIISLFQASTCFKHMCSLSGGQNCNLIILIILVILDYSLVSVWWYQRLYNTILPSWWWAHVLETCRGLK